MCNSVESDVTHDATNWSIVSYIATIGGFKLDRMLVNLVKGGGACK